MKFIYLQLFLLVYINSVSGGFLKMSSAPINMSRVMRNSSAITITACHMQCEKEDECESIAVTEGLANQEPTCHLLKKDDGKYKGRNVMTTIQALGSGPRVNGQWGCWNNISACSSPCGEGIKKQRRKCDSPEPKYGGDYCKGDDQRIVSCAAEERSIRLIDDRPIKIKKGNKIATISKISVEYEIRFKLKVDLSLMKYERYYSVLQIGYKGCVFRTNCRQPGIFIQRQSQTQCYILVITEINGGLKAIRFTKGIDFFDNNIDFTLRQCKTSGGDYYQKLLLNGKLLSNDKNQLPRTFSDMTVYAGYFDSNHPPPPNGQISQLTIKGATGVKKIPQSK